MILFYYLLFILLNKLYGDLIDFSYGPCVGGECIESNNKSFTYICHSDDYCYPDYIFQLDKFYSSGPCISNMCPPSTFCYTDNLCYYETLQICSKQEECPNGYECKDSVCRSLFVQDNELFNVEFPGKFLKHFHKNEIISSCYKTECPENYTCADKFKFPMCLPKHQVEYYLNFHCNDTLIINGKDACLKYKNLCNETIYGKLMHEKCSKTCNTCLSFGSTKYYNDLISKKGVKVCKKYKYLCNNNLYHGILKNICPTTCGKKRVILPPIK